MGANFNYKCFKGSESKASLLETWNTIIEDSLHFDGHDPYSGGFGTMGKGIDEFIKGTRTLQEAEEYLMDNHSKWTPALAVEFQEDNKSGWIIGGWCAE